MVRLNQIVAYNKAVQTRVMTDVSALHHATQKGSLMTGMHREYHPRSVDDEPLPPENQRVQYIAKDVLDQVARNFTELLDITATKDYGNQHAKASVVVNGKPLVTDAPVPYLLFVRKQLEYMRTFVEKMTQLDSSVEWEFEGHSGLWKTQRIATSRTKKMPRPIVKYEATPQHPAQTEMIMDDVFVGTWSAIKLSGGLSPKRRQAILGNIDKVLRAVHDAIETANLAEVQDVHVGHAITSFLFNTEEI